MNVKYTTGIVLKLTNGLLFAILSLLMVACSKYMAIYQILFLRNTVSIFICVLFFLLTKKPILLILPRKRTLYYVIRGFISVAAMYVWIVSLNKIGLNEATAVSYTTPVWTLLFANLIIRERFDLICVAVLCVNIVGMLIALQPHSSGSAYQGVLIAMLSSLLWAAYDTICKMQSSSEHFILQAFYASIWSVIILLPVSLYHWAPVPIEVWPELAWVCAIGFVNVVVLFLAYSYAPLTLLVPFSYSRLLFTILLSYWVDSIVPNAGYFIGIAIILISNMYLYWRKAIAPNPDARLVNAHK